MSTGKGSDVTCLMWINNKYCDWVRCNILFSEAVMVCQRTLGFSPWGWPPVYRHSSACGCCRSESGQWSWRSDPTGGGTSVRCRSPGRNAGQNTGLEEKLKISKNSLNSDNNSYYLNIFYSYYIFWHYLIEQTEGAHRNMWQIHSIERKS